MGWLSLHSLHAKSFVRLWFRVRCKLQAGVFDYLPWKRGGRKELKAMYSQVNSQVFTGCCTKQICMIGWEPNKPFDCSEVIYSQEENLTNFSAIKGSKDSFRISHFKFVHFWSIYILTDCVAQGSFEWWEKEEKSFCSSWSHWRSRGRLLFSYSRKSWRRSAENIKNRPCPVFRSWLFSQSSQSSGVRSVKNHWSTFWGVPSLLTAMGDKGLPLRSLVGRRCALAEQWLLAASGPFVLRCGCPGLGRREGVRTWTLLCCSQAEVCLSHAGTKPLALG